jgi:hypothetical protein
LLFLKLENLLKKNRREKLPLSLKNNSLEKNLSLSSGKPFPELGKPFPELGNIEEN